MRYQDSMPSEQPAIDQKSCSCQEQQPGGGSDTELLHGEASCHLASRESQATVRRQQLKVNAKPDRRFIRSTHGRHLPDLRWGTTRPIPERSSPTVDALDMPL